MNEDDLKCMGWRIKLFEYFSIFSFNLRIGYNNHLFSIEKKYPDVDQGDVSKHLFFKRYHEKLLCSVILYFFEVCVIIFVDISILSNDNIFPIFNFVIMSSPHVKTVFLYCDVA